MEMMYDGALVMPNNYAVVNEEEMTYVNGGWCIETHWWGYNIYLTHSERQLLAVGQTIAGLVLSGVPAVIFKGLYKIFKEYDDGYGIRIRMTGLYAQASITGVYSLTKSQEKNIASKNKVI